MDRVIIVPDANDEKYGYLSNFSYYPITIEGKRYPTAAHYIYSSKFAGTSLAEEIRNAATVYQAEFLSRGRNILTFNSDGDPIKKTVYGSEKNCESRDDWEDNMFNITEEAILAKFEQNPTLQRKLASTSGEIIDKKFPCSGLVLMRYREKLIDQFSNVIPPITAKLFQDLPYPDFYSRYDRVISRLYHSARKVMKMEGWDIVHAEMLEDALYNLWSGSSKTFECFNEWRRFMKRVSEVNRRELWLILNTRLRNIEQLIDDIHEYLVKKDERYRNSYKLDLYLALTLYFIYMSPRRKRLISAIEGDTDFEWVLIPEERDYRRQIPPMMRGK